MRISYDEEVDALYVQLVEGDHECRTVRLTDEVALDFGPQETLVGIEVLDAKRLLGRGKLPQLAIDNLSLRATPDRATNGGQRRRRKAPAKGGRRLRKAG